MLKKFMAQTSHEKLATNQSPMIRPPTLLVIFTLLIAVFVPVAHANSAAATGEWVPDEKIKTIMISGNGNPRTLDESFMGSDYIYPTVAELADATFESRGDLVKISLAVNRTPYTFILKKEAVETGLSTYRSEDITDYDYSKNMAKLYPKLLAKHLIDRQKGFIDMLNCRAFAATLVAPFCSNEEVSSATDSYCTFNVDDRSYPLEHMTALLNVTGQPLDEIKCAGKNYLEYLEERKAYWDHRFEQMLADTHDDSVVRAQNKLMGFFAEGMAFYREHLGAQSEDATLSPAGSEALSKIPHKFQFYSLRFYYGVSKSNPYSRCQTQEEVTAAINDAFNHYHVLATTAKQSAKMMAM